jgi:type 1 glutamine amidotransferase
MRTRVTFNIVLSLMVCMLPLMAQQATGAKRKKVLAIGQVKGFQHDSVSHALASIERWGKESGLWDTYIRTDTQLITKKKLEGNAKNLDFFDAVIFYTTGELDMDAQQKADLLAFVRDGKGFVGVHSATDTFYNWPEYGEMIGGYFDKHPWNTFQAPIIVEDRDHPTTSHLSKTMVVHDEIYQFKNYSRDKVRVLMRLDENKIDLQNKNVVRTDKDFAVSWVKSYGKGRVFYSTLGHREEVYELPEVKQMYVEAIKWVMGMTEGGTTPHPKQ